MSLSWKHAGDSMSLGGTNPPSQHVSGGPEFLEIFQDSVWGPPPPPKRGAGYLYWSAAPVSDRGIWPSQPPCYATYHLCPGTAELSGGEAVQPRAGRLGGLPRPVLADVQHCPDRPATRPVRGHVRPEAAGAPPAGRPVSGPHHQQHPAHQGALIQYYSNVSVCALPERFAQTKVVTERHEKALSLMDGCPGKVLLLCE